MRLCSRIESKFFTTIGWLFNQVRARGKIHIQYLLKYLIFVRTFKYTQITPCKNKLDVGIVYCTRTPQKVSYVFTVRYIKSASFVGKAFYMLWLDLKHFTYVLFKEVPQCTINADWSEFQSDSQLMNVCRHPFHIIVWLNTIIFKILRDIL